MRYRDDSDRGLTFRWYVMLLGIAFLLWAMIGAYGVVLFTGNVGPLMKKVVDVFTGISITFFILAALLPVETSRTYTYEENKRQNSKKRSYPEE